jgi:tricorn protease
VGIGGGTARRLTSNLGEESRAAISPDGTLIAFTAEYEGPAEVYTMPIEGGLPVRRTFEGDRALVTGWTPDGRILYATRSYSTLPDTQLATIDPRTGERGIIPLSQASDGSYDPSSGALFFTRQAFQGSHTKRYRGGTAQNIWVFAKGGGEARPLTSDFAGTSKTPMCWGGRVYFASDRDGAMNLWSMKEDGGDLEQHTFHRGWDVQSPSLSEGRIAYQLGADIHLLDLARGTDGAVPVRLASDFDQMRERWIKAPMDFLTSIHVSPKGDRVVLTARGQVFVAPAHPGRLVEATRKGGVRYRQARFTPDGKSLLALSDESGEIEIWKAPANGVGPAEQLTSDGQVLRWDAVPSPDLKWIAHYDKDQRLWLYSVEKRKSSLIETSPNSDFTDLSWSPDSRWLAYAVSADDTFQQIKIYGVETGAIAELTTDRYDSSSPAWSADGKWIYFLSDRNLDSVVEGPWGSRQPEPFFDRPTRIYEIALRKGIRSPFRIPDELAPADANAPGAEPDPSARPQRKEGEAKVPPTVTIDLDGIESRIEGAPVPAGNYDTLATDGKRLYWISRESTPARKASLQALAIDNKGGNPETFLDDIRSYELSADGTSVMVRKGDGVYIFEAGTKAPADLSKSAVSLKAWTFPLDPREEWRQMFLEAWRLERDYFYDQKMHGLDWPAIRDKYLPLAGRVTDREELSDLLGQMVGELSALHIFVRGGDAREALDKVEPASLGALLARDEAAGGFRIEHIYRSDPDVPDRLSPLARLEVGATDGDVIESINGVSALSVPDPGALLREQAGRQVLLRLKPASGPARDVIVAPISPEREGELRYDEWEYTRRLDVDRMSDGKIGYVHLTAMGGRNLTQWYRDFYPVFKREGLVVDVRHNRGGNIDSLILEKLLRRAWLYWQGRVGNPYWNMQYAFRGHIAVLCDEHTASDGEMFAEGFRRLGLGKVIGTRTWGGEIWLTSSNVLVDKGIATAAEFGVYGPEGAWLIEGHGVDPDIVVDNLPHATFEGDDAQLKAAVDHLMRRIKEEPVTVPPAPAYPDKSLKEGRPRP